MKKKLLPMLLLVVIVFNFICTSPVYAEPDDLPSGIPESNGEGTLTEDQVDGAMNGEPASNGSQPSLGSTLLGTIFQVIALMLNSFPMTIQAFTTQLAKNPTDEENPLKAAMNFVMDLGDLSTYFTIERTVFNEVALFNIDIFNQDDTYTIGTGDSETTIQQVSTIKDLKLSTAKWFYTCRLLAMMINLVVLIYIGIRMALSTIASEEARYKKMLMSWLESMIVLFLLHYIMAIVIQLGNIAMNILYNLREGMTVEGFETIIMKKIYSAIAEQSGMQVFLYSVFFWFLTFIHVKFFLTYLKRVLSVMFLTIIAPLITITYPIDKLGDNKAQAFENWLKEYLINIAIQPIHAAIYLVFVFTAGEIAETAPFVAMIFLLSLGTIEKIVRNIFKIDSVSVQNFDEELKKGKKGK